MKAFCIPPSLASRLETIDPGLLENLSLIALIQQKLVEHTNPSHHCPKSWGCERKPDSLRRNQEGSQGGEAGVLPTVSSQPPPLAHPHGSSNALM